MGKPHPRRDPKPSRQAEMLRRRLKREVQGGEALLKGGRSERSQKGTKKGE